MNNKQYELIGESIWSTYKDLSYIYVGEEKESFLSRGKQRLAALAGRVARRRKRRLASRQTSTTSRQTSTNPNPTTTAALQTEPIEHQRAREKGNQ